MQDLNEIYLKLIELEKIGIDPVIVVTKYQNLGKRHVNIEEVVRVTFDEEARGVKIESLDSISVTVPVFSAAGGRNKIE